MHPPSPPTVRPLSRPCAVCDCKQGNVLFEQVFVLPDDSPLPRQGDVVACRQCGFCFADSPAGQSAYDSYYEAFSKYAAPTESTGAGVVGWDQQRLKDTATAIANFEPGRQSRILDVGCAAGGLLRELATLGFSNLIGMDPAPACVEITRKISAVEAVTGSLSQWPGEEVYDGIILSHVMEHVLDLKSCMEKISRRVSPEGWLYVEVPDAENYHDFVVSPFQDFNTEHINHFSETSLGNLFGVQGFETAAAGRKGIFSSKDIPYPALFMFLRKTGTSKPWQRDDRLPSKLGDYVSKSWKLMESMCQQLETWHAQHPEIYVWGTGQLALKLLAISPLKKFRIPAFIDSNPIHQGRRIGGIPVVSGREVSRSDLPIFISSTINSAAILETMRDLGISNPVLVFNT